MFLVLSLLECLGPDVLAVLRTSLLPFIHPDSTRQICSAASVRDQKAPQTDAKHCPLVDVLHQWDHYMWWVTPLLVHLPHSAAAWAAEYMNNLLKWLLMSVNALNEYSWRYLNGSVSRMEVLFICTLIRHLTLLQRCISFNWRRRRFGCFPSVGEHYRYPL